LQKPENSKSQTQDSLREATGIAWNGNIEEQAEMSYSERGMDTEAADRGVVLIGGAKQIENIWFSLLLINTGCVKQKYKLTGTVNVASDVCC